MGLIQCCQDLKIGLGTVKLDTKYLPVIVSDLHIVSFFKVQSMQRFIFKGVGIETIKYFFLCIKH